MPGRILVVCEKPSVGRDIARVLGAKERARAICKTSDTWSAGLWAPGLPAMPEEIDPAGKDGSSTPCPCCPRRSPKGAFRLQKAVQRAEKAAFEPRHFLRHLRNGRRARGRAHLSPRIRPFRLQKARAAAWISSMTDPAIREGFQNLQPLEKYDNLYKSANCRAEADWLVGMNGSRAFTLRYNACFPWGACKRPRCRCWSGAKRRSRPLRHEVLLRAARKLSPFRACTKRTAFRALNPARRPIPTPARCGEKPALSKA